MQRDILTSSRVKRGIFDNSGFSAKWTLTYAPAAAPEPWGWPGGGGGHRKRALQRPGCFVPTGPLTVHAGRLPGGRWKRTSKGKKLRRAGVQNAHRPEPLLAQLGNRAFSVGWISTRLAAASWLSDLTVPWSC